MFQMGSYDCYQYKNGKWIFKQDIDARVKNTSFKKNKIKKRKDSLENKMLTFKIF